MTTPANDTGKGIDSNQPRKWERWIRGIGFGIYILAALGVLFYAGSISKAGLNWPELRPFVLGIVVVGVVLYLLSYGQTALKTANLGEKTKKAFATIILSLFAVIAASAAVWVVVLILRDVDILPNRADGKNTYINALENAHKTNVALIDQVIQQKPSSANALKEVKKETTKVKDDLVHSILSGDLNSGATLRPRYNQTLRKIEGIDPTIRPHYYLWDPKIGGKKDDNNI